MLRKCPQKKASSSFLPRCLSWNTRHELFSTLLYHSLTKQCRVVSLVYPLLLSSQPPRFTATYSTGRHFRYCKMAGVGARLTLLASILQTLLTGPTLSAGPGKVAVGWGRAEQGVEEGGTGYCYLWPAPGDYPPSHFPTCPLVLLRAQP